MGKLMPSSISRIGFWLSLSGALLFSTKAIWVKLAYRDTDIDAVSLLLLRMLFSFPFYLILFVWVGYKDQQLFKDYRLWLGMLAMGIVGYYASSLFDFIGLQYVSAGLERLILFVYPTLAVLINKWFFKTPFKKKQRWALLITYMGIVIACYSEIKMLQVKDGFYFGCGMILLCAITFAIYLVGTGRLVKQAGVIRYTSTAMLAATAGIVVHYLVLKGWKPIPMKQGLVGYSIALALLATVIPSLLISSGMKRIGSNQVSIITSIGPVSTILQAHWFLGEPITGWQIFGTILVIVGVLLISDTKKHSETPLQAT
jgi:drug/metabolite transporter (DMT)-like permease